MKTAVFLVAGAFLVSFSSREIDAVDGIWTGAYRSDNVREKVLVKFESENHMELYNGTVEDANRFTGSYELQGDSVVKLTYTNSAGKSFIMKGHINKRRNYLDGTWETSDKISGSFYLKKEKIEEMFVQP
jgi:hypothetical protein